MNTVAKTFVQGVTLTVGTVIAVEVAEHIAHVTFTKITNRREAKRTAKQAPVVHNITTL